jgi:hypothetical protein
MACLNEGEEFRNSLMAGFGEDAETLLSIEPCVPAEEWDDLHSKDVG